MNIKGIIWGSSYERAKSQYDEIKLKYEWMQIPIKREITNKYNTQVEYENGDKWIVRIATESAKGSCCNISYIDRQIDLETIRWIIQPCTKALPFTAFHYYGDYPEEYEGPWLL